MTSARTTQDTPSGRVWEGLSPVRKVQLLGVLLAAIAVAYALSAIGYGTGIAGGDVQAGALPFALGALLLVLSLTLVVAPGKTASPDAAASAERRREFRESAKFFGAFVGYVGAVTLVGFLLGTAVSVPLLLRFVFRYAWLRAVLAGLVMAGVGYALFSVALGVQLP